MLEKDRQCQIRKNNYLPKNLYNPTFSPRKSIRTLGYKKAKEMGVLEIYKDAWGVNFNRHVDFQKKYPDLCDSDVDSEWTS